MLAAGICSAASRGRGLLRRHSRRDRSTSPGWLARAPLVAPDRDGVGGAGTERGQSKTAGCQHGRHQTSDPVHGRFLSRARPWAVTCAVEYGPRDWLPISINIDPAEILVTSGGLL